MVRMAKGWGERFNLGLRLFASATLAFAAAACQPIEQMPGSADAATPTASSGLVPDVSPGDIKYFPSDEPLKMARQRFVEGNFGLAQHYFQDAVEKSPRDATAWLGLAASYDRLTRFDLADRSYRAAVRLVGSTPQILNNEGYSYMLRGKLKLARAKFQQALRRDPNNQTIINNLALLDSSTTYILRDGEPQQ